MSAATKLTPKKREKFCKAIIDSFGNITRAAKAAGTTKEAVYKLRKKDESFRAAWDAALDTSIANLESECHRRAFKGVRKGVFYKGQKVAEECEYSDTLAIFLLKGAKPLKYRDNVNLSGGVEQKVRFTFGKAKLGQSGPKDEEK